jgi:hypothetical protein
LVRLLYLDSVVQIHDGNRADVVRNCLAMANAAHTLRDEPMMVSQLIRISCFRYVVRTLEQLLAHGSCTDAELATLLEMLADAALYPGFLIAIRGDRATRHDALGSLEAGDLSMEEFMIGRDPKDRRPPPRPKEVRLLHVWVLQHYTKVVKIAKLPTEERRTLLEALDAEQKPAPLAGSPVFDGLVWMHVKLESQFSRHLAELRCCLTASAVERFRLAHGEWPSELAAVVPKYLKGVPQDPYDGQPLRYRRTANGVVVNSIWKDPDDGQKTPDRTGQRPDGIGFQLWDPKHRSQSP